MKIGEAAKKAGISPGNIRFYEKKGLLKPSREESSSYRNYTEEDVERLKRILVLRKTDLSVENIFLLLDGKEDPGFLLRKQEEILENQMRELEGSLLLCRKLEQEEDLLKADPEKYLQFIQKEEQKGRRFSPAEELLGELSDFTAECYGGSGWFTAVFGNWAEKNNTIALSQSPRAVLFHDVEKNKPRGFLSVKTRAGKSLMSDILVSSPGASYEEKQNGEDLQPSCKHIKGQHQCGKVRIYGKVLGRTYHFQTRADIVEGSGHG